LKFSIDYDEEVSVPASEITVSTTEGLNVKHYKNSGDIFEEEEE